MPKRSVVFCLFFLLILFSCETKTKTVEHCGDGFVDPEEECDIDVGENSCQSLGHYYVLGTLRCGDDCRFDLSECGGRCGDNEVNAADGEECDGANLNGNSCQSIGYHGGTLVCTSDCRFQIDDCLALGSCGDGTVQTNFEACDGTNVDGNTCESLEQYPGVLSCTENCDFNMAGCGGNCGDGIVQGAFEACDGTALEEQTCETLGYYPGTLGCNVNCMFSFAGCGGTCGDQIIQCSAGEECDGTELGGATCMDEGKFFGGTSCSLGCLTDFSACRIADVRGSSGMDYGRTMVRDASGGLIVVGVASGAIDGTTNSGGLDILLVGSHADGSHAWTRQWGTSNNDEARAMATASDGSLYVSGWTGNTASEATGLLIKFAADGQFMNTIPLGMDVGTGIVVDAAGNLFVAGYADQAVDGQVHLGNQDIVLSRFDASGNRVWTRQWGTASSDVALAMVLDNSGNLVLTGYTGGALDGQTFAGNTDFFVIRCDPDGNKLWTRQWGTSEIDEGTAIAVDGTGNLFVTGGTSQSLQGQTYLGGVDCFLAKIDSAGNASWFRQLGTDLNDYCKAIVVSPLGMIHFTGYTEGSLNGPNLGSFDLFLADYLADGTQDSVRQWGTAETDYSLGLLVLPTGDLFLTGIVQGPFLGQSGFGGMDFLTLFVQHN